MNQSTSSKLEVADAIFTQRGFVRSIVPYMIFSYVLILLIVFSNYDGRSFKELLVIFLGVFCLITFPQYLRYKSAGDTHAKLKSIHGKAYEELVDSGKLVVTPVSVAWWGAPASTYRKHLPSIE